MENKSKNKLDLYLDKKNELSNLNKFIEGNNEFLTAIKFNNKEFIDIGSFIVGILSLMALYIVGMNYSDRMEGFQNPILAVPFFFCLSFFLFVILTDFTPANITRRKNAIEQSKKNLIDFQKESSYLLKNKNIKTLDHKNEVEKIRKELTEDIRKIRNTFSDDDFIKLSQLNLHKESEIESIIDIAKERNIDDMVLNKCLSYYNKNIVEKSEIKEDFFTYIDEIKNNKDLTDDEC